MHEITLASGKDYCSAWHFPATGDAFAGRGGRPCIVLAPGFAGSRESSLLGYAKAFAASGIDALLFDYHRFGVASGSPRRSVSVRGQRQSYHAALAVARQLPGVDPERIVLWGVSRAGGHVVTVAARDGRVAATISVTPTTDGITVPAKRACKRGLRFLARAAFNGLRDAGAAMTGRMLYPDPVIGGQRSNANVPREDGPEASGDVASPSRRTDMGPRPAHRAGISRPIRSASRVPCPLLVQVGTNDGITSPRTGHRAAAKAGPRAELREYPFDHLGVYAGPGHERALADQLDFLRRALC